MTNARNSSDNLGRVTDGAVAPAEGDMATKLSRPGKTD
jgi:hypothetical protein